MYCCFRLHFQQALDAYPVLAILHLRRCQRVTAKQCLVPPQVCQFGNATCGGFTALNDHGYLQVALLNTGAIAAAYTVTASTPQPLRSVTFHHRNQKQPCITFRLMAWSQSRRPREVHDDFGTASVVGVT